ncbi:MAG: diguanylate cyclase [Mariprofundales bacterium]
MAIALFFFFQEPMQQQRDTQAQIKLHAAKNILHERVIRGHTALVQVAAEPQVADAMQQGDMAKLQNILIQYGNVYSFTTLLLAVDNNRIVLARRNGKIGDSVAIGEVLSRSLLLGEPVESLELINRDLLAKESDALQSLFWDLGLVQVFTAPVRFNGKVIGSLVGGILLSDDTWAGNAVYNRLGVEMAIFGGNPSEASLLHATTSLPRNLWKIGQSLPDDAKNTLSLGRSYISEENIDGVEVMTAYELLIDSRNRIVGVLGVSTANTSIYEIVLRNILKALFIAALIGLLLSLMLVWLVYRDITKPLNILIAAMHSFAAGKSTQINLQTGDQFEELGTVFNNMAHIVLQREERMRKHNEVAKILMSTLQLDELLDQTLKLVIGLTDSSIGAIYVMNAELDMLIPRVHYGMRLSSQALRVGEGFPGRAAKDKELLLVENNNNIDTSNDNMFMELGLLQGSVHFLAYVPLIFQDRCLGVIALGRNEVYREDEKQLFDYVADQIAIALENAIMHQRIHEMSICDGLTGLYNRRYLNNHIKELWQRCEREKQPLSVLLADADNFKAINDNYGHDRGDEVLIVLADVFRSCQRKGDIVARYGGEEFVCVMPDTPLEEAVKIAEQMRAKIAAHAYNWTTTSVTLSIGVSCSLDASIENQHTLLKAADKAMYAAKIQGKNQVVCFNKLT